MNKEQLKQLEKELWSAADNLRANSDLKSSEYSTLPFEFVGAKLRSTMSEFFGSFRLISPNPVPTIFSYFPTSGHE